MGFKRFHKAKLMIKIFSCKSARSFIAGFPAEAGGAGKQLQPHLEGSANANTSQGRKVLAVEKFSQENKNKRQPLQC